MSWNAQMLFAQVGDDGGGDLAGLIESLGILGEPAATGEIDFLGATSMVELTDVAAAVVDGWAVIAGLPVMLASADGFASYSATAPIVVMILGGAATTYALHVYRDGACRRAFVEQEGAVIRDEGEPLDEERDLDDFDYTEARMLEITGRLTVPLSALEPATFQTFTGLPAFELS